MFIKKLKKYSSFFTSYTTVTSVCFKICVFDKQEAQNESDDEKQEEDVKPDVSHVTPKLGIVYKYCLKAILYLFSELSKTKTFEELACSLTPIMGL